MIIHLLRHTKPDINDGICYGQSDIDVLPIFEREAGQIKRACEKIRYDIIFTSPLKRCRKLAYAIAGSTGKVIVDDRLKELDFGRWELKAWENIENEPEAIKWFNDYYRTPVPEGESFEILIKRAGSFLSDLKSKEYKEILIVGHKGVIIAIHSFVYGINDPERLFSLNIPYGGLITIDLNNEA